MFVTQLRQLRLTWEMVLGQRIDAGNLRHLIVDGIRTGHEFGQRGDVAVMMLPGTERNRRAQRDFQDHMLKRTVNFARRSSPFYRELFSGRYFLKRVSTETIGQLPLTNKEDIRTKPSAFLTAGARPVLSMSTTGTTGTPLSMWISRNELEVWAALGAFSMVLQSQREGGCLQINVSSRSSVPIRTLFQWLCLDLPVISLGLVHPHESLACLRREGTLVPGMLVTYPSYLASLVALAHAQEMQAEAFQLHTIVSGSEILSPTLAQAAQTTFGAQVVDSYGQTETAPLSGQVCSQGHLHFDLHSAYVEVLDLHVDEPAEPGAIGRLVVTPYYPLRTCMPLVRYETGDVVRQLQASEHTCELAALPATSPILGKQEQILSVAGQLVTRRDLVEAIESLPSHPWPARFMSKVTARGLTLTLEEQVMGGQSAHEVRERFQQTGLPVSEVLFFPTGFSLRGYSPVRADLAETTFAGAEGMGR